MSRGPFKQKSEVILSDHAYSVATERGLGLICQPQIDLETENKRSCLGLLVRGTTTKATMHVLPPQRTMPAKDVVVVEEGVAALEDLEIIEEPRPATSAQERRATQ
ncbi:hypothetical protein E2C01_069790 [Portunus trituberculatus]|uniref:Uncharacterized protein n=1 Tax=Portunus trituberculatus TaxID=210409 RepID=A0A5B7HZH7_PORTR|nr:hypothetical protein [Portunus trituberculatus]